MTFSKTSGNMQRRSVWLYFGRVKCLGCRLPIGLLIGLIKLNELGF